MRVCCILLSTAMFCSCVKINNQDESVAIIEKSESRISVSSGEQLSAFIENGVDLDNFKMVCFYGIFPRDDISSIVHMKSIEEIRFHYSKISPEILNSALSLSSIKVLRFFECQNIDLLLKVREMPKSLEKLEIGRVSLGLSRELSTLQENWPSIKFIIVTDEIPSEK